MNEETADLRLRYDSNGDENTDEDAEPLNPTLPIMLPSLYPTAGRLRAQRSPLAFAPTEMLAHPRLVRRQPLRDLPPGSWPTGSEEARPARRDRRRFARASSPLERPAPWADPPMYLTPRPRPRLPAPLRNRTPPPAIPLAPRPVTQADDEFDDAQFTEDPDTQPFR